jgi:S-phase kinase-associated protein 1
MADTKEPETVIALDDDMVHKTITLVSSDGKKFEVETKAAFISKLISESLESDKEATELDMPGAKADILELVLQYINHHNGVEPPIIEKPLRSKLMADVVKDKWDAVFIDGIGNKRQQLYDLILAANYMDIKSLLHLGCAKVASYVLSFCCFCYPISFFVG